MTYVIYILILFMCLSLSYAMLNGSDLVIQRNDTSKPSNSPDVVYPMRSAESHGESSNDAVNRTMDGTITIGKHKIYTDFPPKEYNSAAGSCSFAWDNEILALGLNNVCSAYINAHPQDRFRLPCGTRWFILSSYQFYCTITAELLFIARVFITLYIRSVDNILYK